jgi:hypothetical protein
MKNVVEMKPVDRSEDCVKVCRNFADTEAADCDVVIILSIKKGGAQQLFGSNSSHMERAFLHSFFTAWMLRWFRLGDPLE